MIRGGQASNRQMKRRRDSDFGAHLFTSRYLVQGPCFFCPWLLFKSLCCFSFHASMVHVRKFKWSGTKLISAASNKGCFVCWRGRGTVMASLAALCQYESYPLLPFQWTLSGLSVEDSRVDKRSDHGGFVWALELGQGVIWACDRHDGGDMTAGDELCFMVLMSVVAGKDARWGHEMKEMSDRQR
ncbi:hypothetical protein B0T10DRAFT_92502 [Thelonectria olida]|uniref:Uncharacterized protein n=1 Tax=Thelonectria olida TaxID=1576542 RepID=A0A9P9ALU9_9HYPO|nr:hypothetical protein B0T10DRAFT_92502 [Thelonectria olida]